MTKERIIRKAYNIYSKATSKLLELGVEEDLIETALLIFAVEVLQNTTDKEGAANWLRAVADGIEYKDNSSLH